MIDNQFPQTVVDQLRKSMEEDGWKTSQHLPLNWIYKVIITSSKNYSVNINILSDLAEKFESYLAAIKYLESSPRYGEAEVAGINLLLAENTRDWRRTVFNPMAATNNTSSSPQTVVLPEGWKTRQCGSRKYTVSPSGEQFPTRKKALQHMIQSEYSEEKDIDMMRHSMLTEGWKTTDCLPRHWLYKTGEGEGRKDMITILAETGEQFNSYLAAIKYMESSLEFDEEDVKKVNELLAEVKGGSVPSKEHPESSLLPPGWRKRTLGRQIFVVSPEGEQFTNKRKALQAMVRLGAVEGSVGLMRRAMVEEDGWKTSTHLPQNWLFKYSHQEKSTRIDIVTHCGEFFNAQKVVSWIR